MKKLKTFLLISSFFFAVGIYFITPISAQTTTSTESLILQLQNQIKALQEQVTKLQAEVSTTKTELEAVKTELKFTKALSRGATGDEVRQLQEFLKQFPDIYPQGLVTGFFGPLTESAIKKFQEKQGIESIGVVGPKTLSKLNELVTEGAGASGVVPPGLLTAPGIEKKIETNVPTIPPAPAAPTITPPTVTLPITPTPATALPVPTGVCLIKDRYTDIPRFDIANFGNGFAKYAVTGVNTVSGLQTSCTKTVYDYLLQQYCKSNSNPVQRLIETYDYRGIAEPQNLLCGSLGCSFVDCSSVAGLAPIAMPTTATTTTTTTTTTAPTATATSTTTTSSTSQTTTSSSPTTTTTTTTATTPTTTTTTASTTPTTTTPTLTISSISVTATPESTGPYARTTFTWTTNIPADSKVEYTETVFPSVEIGSTAMVTSHSVITSLKSSTTYKYRVKSMASGYLAVSADFTITTSARIDVVVNPSDTSPPVISGLYTRRGLDNLDTIIGINWTTNEPADTQVEYGLTTSYGSLSSLYNDTLRTSHSNGIHAPESDIGKTYHFRARSRDASGNLGVSGDYTAMVGKTSAPDTTPPVISNVRAENITTSGVQIKWTTNEQAGDIVYWDTNSSGSFSNISQARCVSGTNYIVTDHCVNLTGLSSGTIYYYKVSSEDNSTNRSTSNVLQFTTAISLDARAKKIAAISQMIDSLSTILEKLSKLLK